MDSPILTIYHLSARIVKRRLPHIILCSCIGALVAVLKKICHKKHNIYNGETKFIVQVKRNYEI